MPQRERKRPVREQAAEETSAGGIVVRRGNDGPVFLVIRDSYSNWGFPKGHLEKGETPQAAALREVREETGLVDLQLIGDLDTIDWHFQFGGRRVHKVCHFYLLETASARTIPQREEGITDCRWEPFESALRLIRYANARAVLVRAFGLLEAGDATE